MPAGLPTVSFPLGETGHLGTRDRENEEILMSLRPVLWLPVLVNKIGEILIFFKRIILIYL